MERCIQEAIKMALRGEERLKWSRSFRFRDLVVKSMLFGN